MLNHCFIDHTKYELLIFSKDNAYWDGTLTSEEYLNLFPFIVLNDTDSMYYSPIFYKVELTGDALTDFPNIVYDENQPAWSEDNNDYFYYPLYISVPYNSSKPTIIYKLPGYSLTYTWELKWLVDNNIDVQPTIPALNSVSVTCDGIDITDECYSVIENQKDPNQQMVPKNQTRYHHVHTVEIPKYLIGDIIITYTNNN